MLSVCLSFLVAGLSACRSQPEPPPQPKPPPQPNPVEVRLSTHAVRVSGPSPYATCTLGDVGGQRFVNGEVESWVAVNPLKLKEGKAELIGVWMQDRWSNGGGAGLMAASSFDGGATWSAQQLAFNGCAENGLLPAGRASDPWVTFGPDGKAYATALIADKVKRTYAIGTAASSDGGKTWTDYKVLEQRSRQDDTVPVDKETVTADPTKPGTAYAVWMRNIAETGQGVHGPAIFARTTDGGQSWSQPKVIVDVPVGQMTSGSIIVVNPKSGVLYHFFRWIEFREQGFENWVGLQLSRDGGETWSQAERVIPMRARPATHPQVSGSVRSFGELPMPAIDPKSGRLYVTWEDGRFDAKTGAIALAYSDDEGTTWSTPRQVSDSGQTAFRPAVAVNSKGQVGISYYQFTDGAGMKVPTRKLLTVLEPDLVKSTDHAVAGPFDLSYAPKAPGPFLGDYLGLIAVEDWFHLFYVTANADQANPTDVHALSIRP